MSQKIQLNRTILTKIDKVLSKFNKVEFFSLIESHSNGIGTTLDMEFTDDIHGFDTKVTIPLIDVSDW